MLIPCVEIVSEEAPVVVACIEIVSDDAQCFVYNVLNCDTRSRVFLSKLTDETNKVLVSFMFRFSMIFYISHHLSMLHNQFSLLYSSHIFVFFLLSHHSCSVAPHGLEYLQWGS